jgi:hypothetical protein
MRRQCAHAATCALSLATLSSSFGATLSSESSVGLLTGYNSNPYVVANGTAAEAVAVVADVPATYTSDWQSFDLEPRLRYGQTHGAAQLLSDYEYLDAMWRLNGERTTLLIDAGWHRDSTLYNQYENAALIGHDLPRLEDSATGSWQRTLSERSDVRLDGACDQVNYSASSNLRLDNYHSAQAFAAYERTLTELWQWSVSLGFQHYEQPALGSSSDDRLLQTSVTGALSERWSMTTQVGYSLLNSGIQGYVCCQILESPSGYFLQYIPVRQDSSGGSFDYLVSLQRKSERLVLGLSASQSILPSALSATIKQDTVALNATMPWTERFTLSAMLQGSQQSNPLQPTISIGDRRFYDAGLSASWLWTEHWSLGLATAYIRQRTAALSQASSYSVNLTLSRQFGRLIL